MALGRVVTFVAGTTILAADVNGEINNILNNPISLISPTTGAINFNLSAHTNLIPGALTGSSGAAGNTLQTTGGAAFWGSIGTAFTSLTSGQLLVGASSGGFTTLNIGTTGQVLAVTSSNTNPAWQVIPPSGGLSTGAISTGAIYYISTAGVLTPLTVGTSGQVLTLSSGLPIWSSSGLAAAGGAGGFTTTSATYFEDFLTFTTSTRQATYPYSLAAGGNTPAFLSSIPGGVISNAAIAGLAGLIIGNTTAGIGFSPSVLSTVIIRVQSSIAGIRNLGFVPDPDMLTCGVNVAGSTQSILVFQCTGAASTWKALSFSSSGLITTINTTAVGSTTFQRLEFQFTSSGTLATVLTNGVSAGTITSSQLPAVSSSMAFGFGSTEALANAMYIDAWQIVTTRPVTV